MELLILSLVILILIGLAVMLFKKNGSIREEIEGLKSDIQSKDISISQQEVYLLEKDKQIAQHKEDQTGLQDKANKAAKAYEDLMILNTELDSKNKHLLDTIDQERSQNQKNQELLKNEFKVLANEILKSNQKEFSSNLILPFQEKIKSFEKQISESFEKEMRDKISLRTEVQKLYELNTKISEEAHNLSAALKGDSKQQGNWGEFILESILEKSGLVKNSEYFTQQNYTDEVGKRLLPDVVNKLPEEKDLIIDSKVSLTAFERFHSATDDDEREKALKDHVLSFRNHIKNLSQKEYHLIETVNTPEFVLLFTPIESSFNAALKADPELFSFAWERNIVLVCPSTLLATLKTVASVWKQEKQTKNAIKIAEESGKLYDSFVRFFESLDSIDKNLAKTQSSFEEAKKRLLSGKGNIVKRIENLKKMGAKASKQLPPNLSEYEEGLD